MKSWRSTPVILKAEPCDLKLRDLQPLNVWAEMRGICSMLLKGVRVYLEGTRTVGPMIWRTGNFYPPESGSR